MAVVRGSSQPIDLIDLTDGYSVFMTNDNVTFLGTTNSVNGTQTATAKIMALCGSEQVSCEVGTISTPTGISAVSDGKTPEPTVTITATSALKTSGSFVIPVTIGDITINKVFSYAIAFKGTNGANGTSVTVSSTDITYQTSSSGTTAPTGTWNATIPTIPAGQYLWTKTVVTYSDGKSTTAYSVSRNGTNGSNGTSVTVSSTDITYQTSSSGTTAPTGTWNATIPTIPAGQYLWTKTVVTYSDGKSTTAYSVSRNGTNGSNGTSVTVSSTDITYQTSSSGTTAPTGTWVSSPPVTSAGQYLWTKTVVTYSDGKSTTSYSISRNGSNGAAGADAITMVITSSNGLIFKNAAIATTLTAHVYKGGVEVTGASLTALGTIKWYKDGGATAVATGTTFTIAAGDVENKASYTAQLEG
ncbi:hypothetical protein [Novisyntrophococcus fermenticellae]|uniref:hypothetical protein n=1 Tax=Novisyntrophococcus fermenticellae TaxID=2068655 RepID=UPI001E378CEA|nr:hypothetical protein [Novisyntrophococcus fermenticellae]